MGNFFLLNEAIITDSLDNFIDGLTDLLLIKEESREDDLFLKHDQIWQLGIVIELISDSSQEALAITKYINQLDSHSTYINSITEFDRQFPDQCNGFLGFDFRSTSIPEFNQIKNSENYYKFLKTCLPYLNFNEVSDLETVLIFVFKNYDFDSEALEDILYWKINDSSIYSRLLRLLEDIQDNPFSGGIGKTEVLKNENGVASKRITDFDRITYVFEAEVISILRCRGHYD